MTTSPRNFIRCVKTRLHKVRGTIRLGRTQAPQSRLQHTDCHPFFWVAQRHRDIAMDTTLTGLGTHHALLPLALHIRELSMSAQKATEAGITVWDNQGTEELIPAGWRDTDPSHPSPHGELPRLRRTLRANLHTGLTGRGSSLPPHASLRLLQLLQRATLRGAGYLRIPPLVSAERPGHAAPLHL